MLEKPTGVLEPSIKILTGTGIFVLSTRMNVPSSTISQQFFDRANTYVRFSGLYFQKGSPQFLKHCNCCHQYDDQPMLIKIASIGWY